MFILFTHYFAVCVCVCPGCSLYHEEHGSNAFNSAHCCGWLQSSGFFYVYYVSYWLNPVLLIAAPTGHLCRIIYVCNIY